MSRLITGLTRERERAIQQRLMGRLEGALLIALSREIRRAMMDFADNYASPGSMSGAKEKHNQNINSILMRGWRGSADSFGSRILDAANKLQGKNLFVGYDAAVQRWILANSGAKLTEITGTTFKQSTMIIEAAVKESVTAGLSERATGQLIRQRMSDKSAVSVARSRVIARTEVHAASQAGVQMAAEEMDIPAKKEWISALGDSTREDHADADGQVRSLQDAFIVGGESLMYPGDPSGSAEQVINCRCSEGIVIE